ncbi:unnamed protein product, partial [Polarella glacialis]
ALLEVTDVSRALAMASQLLQALPLGPDKLILARTQIDLVKKSGTDPVEAKLQQELSLLESQWALDQAGLASLFGPVLLQHGARACASCIYHSLPLRLLPSLPSRTAEAVGTALGEAASKLGVEGIHKLVDGLCARHGLSAKSLRHQLVERWLLSPGWAPQELPEAVATSDMALACLQDEGSGPAAQQLFAKRPVE